MARDILFKAKRTDNGEWVEGSIITRRDTKRVFMVDIENITALRSVTTNYCDRYDWRAVEVQADTICQYTGLTDKNGNKIWENDVVQHSDEFYRVHFVVRYGEYHNDGNKDCYVGFYADWFQTLDSKYLRKDIGFWVYNRKIEVIGNIFDNPELLKEVVSDEIQS